MIGFAAERLMALETEALVGAAPGERSAERRNQRSGYRDRGWQTRAGTVELRIPKLRHGSYFAAFLEPRRMARPLARHRVRPLRRANRAYPPVRNSGTSSPGGGYRRDHLRALAQRVEVADREVRIMGSKGELLRTLTASAGVKSAPAGVSSSVPSWRMGWDSNPRTLSGWRFSRPLP